MINPDLLCTLFYWCEERETIRRKKEGGDPKPWTRDPILRDYRFCNVRREDDKVTRWIAEYIRKPFARAPMLPVLITLARHVNRIETLEKLEPYFNAYCYNPEGYWHKMLEMQLRGEQIFGAAYVIRAESDLNKYWYGYPKVRYVAEIVCGQVLNNLNTLRDVKDGPTGMEDVWRILAGCYGLGEFMAFQITVDLRHTTFLEKAADRNYFVAFGPGTRRGLNRLYGRELNKGVPRGELEYEIRQVQAHIYNNTDFDLEPYDVANVMCEFDKYLRGKPKQRYPGDK